MTENDSGLGPDIEHAAISRAWEQVDSDDLMKALRKMPSKVRGRMLSQLKTPSSKITNMTARLLATNLARSRHQDRYRAADTLAGPLVDSLGDTADEVADLAALRQAIEEKAETWGRSIVVLAAVAGVVNETERFAPVLVACAEAGWLAGTLDELAATLADPAAQRLAERASEEGADDKLEEVWERAGYAAVRVASAVNDGAVPKQDDLDVVDHYIARLTAEAERYQVEPTVAAVGAAVSRAELDAAVADLASRLMLLSGPDELAGELAEVRDAAAMLGDDAALVERLGRFLEVVSGQNPIVRLKLAGELRTQPSPPAGALLDAAMIGLLKMSDSHSGATVITGPTAVPAAGDTKHAAVPASEATENAAGLADSDSGPDGAEPSAESGEPRARTGETPSVTEPAEPGPAAAEHSDPEPPHRSERVGPRQRPATNAVDVGDQPPLDVAAATAEAPPAARQVRATAVEDTDDTATVEVVPAGPVGSGGTTEEPAGDSAASTPEAPDGDECAHTLARLIAGRRYSLAAHLANALGQELRAEILAEAALAEGVRRAASPAAAALVERALTVSVPPDDRGSVALRAASGVRASLLDPASGAGELLRPLLEALSWAAALREFAVAVLDAAVQNLSLSSTRSTANGSASPHEQASTISSWAQDMLGRPRHRVGDVGKEVTAPSQPAGEILAALAADDASRLSDVRERCRVLSTTKGVDRAISDAEAALGANHVRVHRIVGGARQALVRTIKEIVDQGWAWCDVHSVRRPGGGLGRVESAARDLRERLGELSGDGDELNAAALAAAVASLSETIDLVLGSDPLTGNEPDPASVCDQDLVLVAGLDVDDHGAPLRAPTAEELVAAASTSRGEAFTARLAAGDYPAAEAVVYLPPSDTDTPFDTTAAMRELRESERANREALGERWATLERAYASARARGRVSETDAAEIGARLEQANPEPEGDTPRRDLGRLRQEMDRIDAALEAALNRRRVAVRSDIDEAKAHDELSQAWTVRLDELLERDELGAAEEYLHRARADEETPDDPSDLHQPDEMLGTILAGHPGGVTEAVVELVLAGGSDGSLDFSKLDAEQQGPIADGLKAWIGLRDGERPANLEEPLLPLLRLLGIIPRAVNRPPELRAASKADYFFADIDGDNSGKAYVPDYGTRAGERRRFMLCWATDLPISQLWDLARSHAPDDQPIYVLYFGVLSAKARVELARMARTAHGKGVVIIDGAVALRCAVEGRFSYDVTMRAVLPYGAPNPYDPNLLSGMPPEMFYGRRAERESVKSLSGTSIISGGRRFGKSALLRSAQRELDRSPDLVVELLVIQDVAAPPRNDPGELWPRLAARLIEKEVLDPSVALDVSGVCSGIRGWLTVNPHKRLLVMLDECDLFLRADANAAFTNVVHLRNEMVDSENRFKVVFSGLQHVARYRRLPNQPLSHFSHPLVIGPLDATSASELVRRPLAAVGWSITDAQVDRIVTFCACNPSVIQLTCAGLLDRLQRTEVSELAPWDVPDPIVDDLLHSPEIRRGLRTSLFLTLDLDHRYKLLGYLMAWRADTSGLAEPVAPAELRRMAVEWWPEGFASQRTDDVRALCDELVGLGVFAGDAEGGYRMLSPGLVRVFGDSEEINDELVNASDNYDTDLVAGAAGSRMPLGVHGDNRYSPLTAAQLADVIGAGQTQLRVVLGSRATRVDAVTAALVAGTALYPPAYASVSEVTSLKGWRDSMRAPATGHLVVVSDLTAKGSQPSWEQSIDSGRRRGGTRTGRGTRSAVLVAGPDQRWLLRRMVDVPGTGHGDLADFTVPLGRVDATALQAWNHIEELYLPSQTRQRRLLAVTGGWPLLVERVLAGRAVHGGPDRAMDALEAHLATPEGAAELIAAVGLDPQDPDQPADAGLIAVFDRLVVLMEGDRAQSLSYLAGLLELDDGLRGEDDPAEAVAILALLGVLDAGTQGLFMPEPVMTRAWKLRASVPQSVS